MHPRAPIVLASLLLLAASSAWAQTPHSRSLFLKARTGLSSYLGDNNTALFGTDAFNVRGKRPYSVGFEAGYQWNDRWSASLGLQLADYPIITRFYRTLNVENDPTTRRTFQLLIRRMLNERRLSPYLHFGFHVTFGDVNIFEATRLWKEQPLNTQSHYIYGPLFGLGLDYALSPRFSLFAEVTSHVTLMDDSVDGRLPLGPPQPSSFGEKNRFGTFDLLSAVGFGVLFRPWCHEPCSGATAATSPGRRTRRSGSAGQSMVRFSKTLNDENLTASYHRALPGFNRLFVGLEGALVPRSIAVRYTYPDGQQSTDETRFTGAYAGLSARFFPLRGQTSRLLPQVGFTAGVPAQAQLIAGVDYRLSPSLTLGLEGRYAYCPTRRQVFHKEISYDMIRVCEYEYGLGLAVGYRLE